MNKLKPILGIILFTQLLISCGEVTTVDSVPKSKEISGDFSKNIEVASEKITLNIKKENGSDYLVANIELKNITSCPGCTYDFMTLQLLDEKDMTLGELEFDRSEGDQVEKLNSLIQGESDKVSIEFTGGTIGNPMSKEEMQDIIEKCKSFSIAANALKIPTSGELLIGQEKFGGMIVSANEKGDHGLVISLEDLSTEADWSTAKQVCASYNANGTSGWRLPTKSEMELIYSNLAGKQMKNDLEDTYYWTETVYNHNFGTTWPYSFDYSRGESDHTKGMVNKFHVRAVKSF